MLKFQTLPRPVDRARLPLACRSNRPALTHLVLLASANPAFAARLLSDQPLEIAVDHPHYCILLDAQDRATIDAIRARAHTIGEFLEDLADVADGAS